MNQIKLNSEGVSGVTIIPNDFINKYMSMANGAYVKVYLYLLHCCQSQKHNISISNIADHLDNTEKDIIRALNYWGNLGLILTSRDSSGEILSLDIVNMDKQAGLGLEDHNFSENITSSKVTPNPQASPPQQPAPTSCSLKEIPDFTDKDQEEIKWTMDIVEIYMGRPLKPMEIKLILYLYEDLSFSKDLIMYLFEYCIENGKKNTSYIEKVALDWHSKNIDTEKKAKTLTFEYNDYFNTVKNAFGLNRAPGEVERQFITKWSSTFGFASTIIKEACDRTILRTQKADFKYADKILETWHKKEVQSLNDIKRLDKEFAKGKKINGLSSKVTPITKNPNNRFNQFPQRSYSAKDYDNLERKLLNKS